MSERPTYEELVEVLEGIDHFADAVAYREDTLSRALRRWLDAGNAILSRVKQSEPKP